MTEIVDQSHTLRLNPEQLKMQRLSQQKVRRRNTATNRSFQAQSSLCPVHNARSNSNPFMAQTMPTDANQENAQMNYDVFAGQTEPSQQNSNLKSLLKNKDSIKNEASQKAVKAHFEDCSSEDEDLTSKVDGVSLYHTDFGNLKKQMIDPKKVQRVMNLLKTRDEIRRERLERERKMAHLDDSEDEVQEEINAEVVEKQTWKKFLSFMKHNPQALMNIVPANPDLAPVMQIDNPKLVRKTSQTQQSGVKSARPRPKSSQLPKKHSARPQNKE